jgi:hypothetical protein
MLRPPLVLALLTAALAAQAPTFATPVRLTAPAGTHHGHDRLYPSPALHDVDGDGRPDLVLGDLEGSITVARRLPGDGTPAFAAPTPLRGADGRPFAFHNW